MKRRLPRVQRAPTRHGHSSVVPSLHRPDETVIEVKTGGRVPAGAKYLCNVDSPEGPKFYFLVTKAAKKKSVTIGFRVKG